MIWVNFSGIRWRGNQITIRTAPPNNAIDELKLKKETCQGEFRSLFHFYAISYSMIRDCWQLIDETGIGSLEFIDRPFSVLTQNYRVCRIFRQIDHFL